MKFSMRAFADPQNLRLMADQIDRDPGAVRMSATHIRFVADRIEALEAARAALLAACEAFVGYYDQAGIGDCSKADEEARDRCEMDDNFDGDETMNVRMGRAAIALATGQEDAK